MKDEAITLAVEPGLGTVADALTTQWLRPTLEDENHPDAEEALVWYDTSLLRVRANRPQTALEVYDRGVISDEALRRETGFDDADAPKPGERRPNRNEEQQDGGERGWPGLTVDESEELPASAGGSTLEWLERRGRDIGEWMKRQHGLDNEQLDDALRAIVAVRGGRRDDRD